MATKRDLLKEAIADAKAVKDTAIENAKLALEETFTPYFKEKLSAKLAEIEAADDEKEEVKEETVNETETEAGKVDEISLDELLAELDGETAENVEEAKKEGKEDKDDEEIKIEDMSETDLKKFIETVIGEMVEAGEIEAGETSEEEAEEPEGVEAEESAEVVAEDEVEEDVDLEELLAELDGEEELEEAGSLTKTEKTTDASNDAYYEEHEKVKEELEEAYKAVETLRKEINEVNLLNAKLLYTNKIFRNKTLNESQKIKVLAAFDKATTKKEVELVYETLTEGFKTSSIKSSIKESIIKSSSSQPLGSAKKPIVENDSFARMRKLAGLK